MKNFLIGLVILSGVGVGILYGMSTSTTFIHPTAYWMQLSVAIITVLMFYICYNANQKSRHAFLNSIMGTTFLRFFMVAVTVLCYLVLTKVDGDEKVQFVINLMGIYFFYQIFEIAMLLSILRQKSKTIE